ncbi:carbohydrate-binding protein CenC [Pseudomonas frederiksbergensis]|uniref:carbohydrate-binding protein CenC n=1 Tax=Pseudomonas frederiksbergensis TaxID=104087 RepID=UPI000F4AD63B|nr:carbohydrate-binding protein CenC [Pseudomonas frederiksbergensis]RON56986.1 carbohydrate-binding protein CenC [Pseudomonas frederiksbergensis]
MDYPNSVPSAGLVNGRFVDEDPMAGTPGSLIPASWGNGVTEEIRNAITEAGLTPKEDRNDQLATAIRQLSKPDPLQNFPAQVYRKNVLINGGFDIWQRGSSNIGPNIGGFIADRFRCDWNGNAGVNITQQNFVLGQTEVPNEPRHFLRWQQVTAGTGATVHKISQAIESVRTLAGKVATVTFWAKSDAARPLKVSITQYFGPSGSASVDNTVGNFQLTTSWARYTATFQVPSLAGKMLGNVNNDYLRLAFDLPLNVLQTVDLAQIQLEEGPVSTPFEYLSIPQQLIDCQRYFEKSFNAGILLQAGNGTTTCQATFTQISAANSGQYGMTIPFLVQKRAQATIAMFSPGDNSNQVWNQSMAKACTGTTVQGLTNRNIAFATVTAVGSVPGHTLQLEWTADAEL